MTAGFSASVIVVGKLGQIEGEDLQGLARFLRASDGVAKFNLEPDCQQYNNCLLMDMDTATSEALLFSFGSITILDPQTSDPNASYP